MVLGTWANLPQSLALPSDNFPHCSVLLLWAVSRRGCRVRPACSVSCSESFAHGGFRGQPSWFGVEEENTSSAYVAILGSIALSGEFKPSSAPTPTALYLGIQARACSLPSALPSPGHSPRKPRLFCLRPAAPAHLHLLQQLEIFLPDASKPSWAPSSFLFFE